MKNVGAVADDLIARARSVAAVAEVDRVRLQAVAWRRLEQSANRQASARLLRSDFVESDVQLLLDGREPVHREFEIFLAVGDRYLHSDAGLALGHDRVRKANHVHALGQ